MGRPLTCTVVLQGQLALPLEQQQKLKELQARVAKQALQQVPQAAAQSGEDQIRLIRTAQAIAQSIAQQVLPLPGPCQGLCRLPVLLCCIGSQRAAVRAVQACSALSIARAVSSMDL